MNFGGSIRINKCGLLLLVSLFIFSAYYLLSKSESSSAYSLTRNPNEINLRKLLIGSIQAAQMGGIEVVNISKDPNFQVNSKGKTKEGANDPVTAADFQSHCKMQMGLSHLFPKLKIISEEDSSKSKCGDVKFFYLDPTVLHETISIPDEIVNIGDVTVWIDPLDATQEYTEKLFQYVTTMVCVAVKGKPVIGVLHNPFTLQTTWAWMDKALSEDIQKIKKDDEPTKNPILVVSRSHAGDVKNFSKTIFGDNVSVLPAGGAGYKVLQVVFSRATAYLHTTAIKKWDICAGNAILNALGGKMTNLVNEEIDYSQDQPVLNDKGLLAVMNNHDEYIKKIMESKSKIVSA